MPLDFPSNPVDGQVYEDYYYDATVGVWNSLGNSDIPNILSNGVFTASSGTTVPLTVNGASGQSANLQEWKSQAGATLASMNANGGLSLNTPLSVQNGGTGTSSLTLNGYLKGTGTSAITSQSGIPAGDLTSGTINYSRFPSGSVVQVVQTVDTAVTAFSGGSQESFFAYSNLNTTVVPRLSGSRFLVRFQVNVGAGATGGTSFRAALNINGTTYGTSGTGASRSSSNSTYVSGGLPGDATIHALTGEFLFQNTGTSNVVVDMSIFKQSATQTIYINRAFQYDDTARGRPASWLTIQEIAA
jgi:hypothetical protein